MTPKGSPLIETSYIKDLDGALVTEYTDTHIYTCVVSNGMSPPVFTKGESNGFRSMVLSVWKSLQGVNELVGNPNNPIDHDIEVPVSKLPTEMLDKAEQSHVVLRPRKLTNVIIDLNDLLKWTREEIADWLDTLDEQPVFYPKFEESSVKCVPCVTKVVEIKPLTSEEASI